MECSSLDKLLMVYDNGRYQVMSPPDKLFIDHDLVRCAIYNRESAFTAVYTEIGSWVLSRRSPTLNPSTKKEVLQATLP